MRWTGFLAMFLGTLLVATAAVELEACGGSLSPPASTRAADGGSIDAVPDDDSQPEILGGSNKEETLDEKAGGLLVVFTFLGFIAAGALLPFLLL